MAVFSSSTPATLIELILNIAQISNGIILPLATIEDHSRVSERWEYSFHSLICMTDFVTGKRYNGHVK